MTEKYISFRKAGEMLGVSKDTVRAYVYKGILIAEGEWGNKKILLSSVYNHLKDIDKQAEREVGERLKLINLKLTFLDILSYYKLPITVAYMYEDRLKELVGFPEDQQRKELVKIAQEAIEMDGAVFYSYKPYLQIALTRECIVTFNEKGVYITPAFPKLLYVLEEDNIHEDSKYWYLTELAAKCTAKRMVPDYISEKIMKQLKINKHGVGECYPCMRMQVIFDSR